MLKKISTLIVIIICSLTLSLNIIGCGETQNSALKDITGITFTDVEYDYDGTEKTITILGNLPNGITAQYSNNKGTNAGKYNASVTLKGNGYKDLTLNATLTINKISYDMTSVKWNYTKSFVYDGKEKSVTVSNLPNGVTVKKYTNNTKTQVGNYTASVELNYDNVNYLQPTISPCNWSIIENQGGGNENQGGGNENQGGSGINLSGLASAVISSFGSVPSPWSFLPDSFSPENRAVSNVINYNNFVSVSSIPKNGMGKQLNAVYGVFNKTSVALSYVSKVYAVLNIVKSLYTNFLDNNPEDYKNFSGTAGGINFTLTLTDNQYLISATISSIGIAIYSDLKENSYGAKIQLTTNTVLKYTVKENNLTVGLDILDTSSTLIEMARNNNKVVGMLYEYLTLGDKQITATCAMIVVDNMYTTLIGTKGDFIPTSINRNCEVYRNSNGQLVGTEVKEEMEIGGFTDTYNTLWYNLYDINGISSIKKVDEMNGTNADTIYINNSTDTIHTKLVGLSSIKKAASRRFDIEFKTMYFYKYNSAKGEYEEVKMEIPMMFVQEEYLKDFASDFYDKNKSALSGSVSLTVSNNDKNAVNYGYYTLLVEYDKLKDSVTHKNIIDYCKQ